MNSGWIRQVAMTFALMAGIAAVAMAQSAEQAEAAAKAVKGTKGAAREAALQTAAESWEAVLQDCAATDSALGAKAAWEAGELWRRRGDIDRADQCYQKALGFDGDRYRERATAGRADMARRQQRYDAAIELYRAVVAMRPDSARAHESRLRIGRCLEKQDERGEAIAVYREAIDASATEPKRAIEAANALARAQIAEGDLEGAGASIARAEELAQPGIAAGGKDAERLQKALDKMSARRALQRARDARDDTAADAERLEADSAR